MSNNSGLGTGFPSMILDNAQEEIVCTLPRQLHKQYSKPACAVSARHINYFGACVFIIHKKLTAQYRIPIQYQYQLLRNLLVLVMGLYQSSALVAAAPHTVPQKQPADDVNFLNGTRSCILTADADELNHTSDVNDGVLATDAHYEKEGPPPQPHRFTIDDYDGDNKSEVSEDEGTFKVKDDTTHPRTKRRCCEYDHQEILVETKTYDGCSSSPHRATNTSTEQHSCKIFGEGVDGETFSFWFSILRTNESEEGT